jgi:hypothetical protein
MADKPDTPDTPEDEPETPPETPPAAGMADEVNKWKTLARKHEREAKANADAARKLAELEDANKSEIERATEAATAAEKRAADAELEVLRLEVGDDKGLTAKQAKRLVGSTREELEQDADEILETFGSRSPKAPGGRPREELRGGADPTGDEPEELNPRKLAARIPRQ